MKKGDLVWIAIIIIILIALGFFISGVSKNIRFGDGFDCLDARELFATEAEALEHAEKIGCTGSHMHSEYDKPYMACENHEQPVDLNVVC